MFSLARDAHIPCFRGFSTCESFLQVADGARLRIVMFLLHTLKDSSAVRLRICRNSACHVPGIASIVTLVELFSSSGRTGRSLMWRPLRLLPDYCAMAQVMLQLWLA